MFTATPPDFLLRLASPIGRIELGSDGSAITSLSIERAGRLPWDDVAEQSTGVLEEAARELEEYFAGDRTEFTVPVTVDGTPFQRDVWAVLETLPFGASISYGELGRATGRPTAGRAIGGAVGANPVPIIVPCHRVLAANGRITGYSGGNGIPTKEWLLQHEGVTLR